MPCLLEMGCFQQKAWSSIKRSFILFLKTMGFEDCHYIATHWCVPEYFGKKPINGSVCVFSGQ